MPHDVEVVVLVNRFRDAAYQAVAERVELAKRCEQAINLAVRFGGIDGAHHKTWVIDQMVRILAGERYDAIVKEAKAGKDGPESYNWDVGIPP